MGESYFVLLIQRDDEQKEELVSITSRLSIYADKLGEGFMNLITIYLNNDECLPEIRRLIGRKLLYKGNKSL